MSTPTNLIPTFISQLPEYAGSSTLGFMPYVIDGRTYKVQFTNIAAVGAVPSTRTIATGTGLSGGGDLSENRTISITNGGVGQAQLSLTGVTAGTYGSSTAIPVVVVDDTGRITLMATEPVVVTGYVPDSRSVFAGNGLTGGGSLASDVTLSVSFSSSTPEPLGTASAGVADVASREDHVHPAVNLSDADQTQGALPLGRGGTGDALSPIAGAVAYSNASRFALTAVGTIGQVLTSDGVNAPYWSTITGTGTVTSVAASAGTGISVSGSPITTSGTILITNTAPDRTVVLSDGTGIATSGTYPNFTITNTAPDQVVALTAGTNISITGTYPNFTINATGSSGTVTSVAASGGTTGLSFSGSPITTSGTLTLGGTLAVASGGTGATDAATALTNLGAYPASNPSGFTSNVGTVTSVAASAGTGISVSGSPITSSGTLTITNTAPDQIVALTAGTNISITGTYPSFTINATGGGGGSGTVTSVDVSGASTGLTFTGGPITTSGTITMGGTLAVAYGGTGATTASGARSNLGAAASGANSDITSMSGITGGISLVDNIDFDTTAVVAGAVGRLVWNDGDGTLDLGLKGGNVTLQIGQEEVQRSFNEAAVPMVDGNIVYVSGAQGNRIAVNLAQANAAATSTGTIGMATESIASGAEGFITTQGLVRKLNTILDSEGNALAEGDLLYLSATVLGGYTKIAPDTPDFHVFLGYVVRVHATVGSIFVRPNVYPSLDEINGIKIVSTASGNTLIYDAVAGYYKTNTLTAGTNVSIANGPGSITINATDQYVGTVTSVAATAGTGISVSGSPITSSGTLTITNTAPDQTVVLTAGANVTITGTYPSFTIASTGGGGGGTVGLQDIFMLMGA